MSEPILQMKNINKKFGHVIALKDVNLDVYPGEIRGLIGENGSGKSTISSIAAGMQKATSGDMYFKGDKWQPANMIDALKGGIGMIVQESGTIAGVTVAENIFLGEINQFKNKLCRTLLNSISVFTEITCNPWKLFVLKHFPEFFTVAVWN